MAYTQQSIPGWEASDNRRLKRWCERLRLPWPCGEGESPTTQQRHELIHAIHEAHQQRERMKRPVETSMQMVSSVVNKFGGIPAFVKALRALYEVSGDARDLRYRRSRYAVMRWGRPRGVNHGLDGMIPHQLWPGILRAARYAGVVLTPQDFVPELFEGTAVIPSQVQRGEQLPTDRKRAKGRRTRPYRKRTKETIPT